MCRYIRLFIVFIYVLGSHVLSAQTYNEYKQQKKEELSTFKSQREKEFSDYRSELNAQFADYLRQTWSQYCAHSSPDKPQKEPHVPPVVLPYLDENVDIPDEEIKVPDIQLELASDVQHIPLMPKPSEKLTLVKDVIHISFFGTECALRFDGDMKILLEGCSEDDVADMWEKLSSSYVYDSLFEDCIAVKENLNLSDWGYYKFIQSVANQIYRAQSNESIVLITYLMSNSGYKLRMGRLDKNVLCVLLGVEDGIYGCLSVTVDGEVFYLVDIKECSTVYVMKTGFPNEKGISLALNSQQRFSYSPMESRLLRSTAYRDVSVSVRSNKNVMDFYNTYPHPYNKKEHGASWVYYANAPLDQEVQSELYPVLRAAISGKSQKTAANILLNFVQTAFEYKTDNEYWGYERPLFSSETLCYPYSDCGDRSILYSRLIRDLIGLDVVFLHYEGHLATAVAFDEDITGEYVKINGRKYLVCDPTYINASIGMEMPDLKLLKVIKIN